MPILFTGNGVGAKMAKRDMVVASLAECAVSDTLPVDIRESYNRRGTNIVAPAE